MPDLSSEEIAYAAGFFDGEGHIAIAYRPKSKTVNRYGQVYFSERFSMHVEIGQKDKTPLIWIKNKFGGTLRPSVCKRSYDGASYHWWVWVLNAVKAAEFLTLVRPFLIVKQQEADVAIGFQATIDHARRRKNDPKIMQLRQAAFAKIRLIREAK